MNPVMHISSFFGLETLGLLSIFMPLVEVEAVVEVFAEDAFTEEVFEDAVVEAFEEAVTVELATVLVVVLEASTLATDEVSSDSTTELASELVTSSEDVVSAEDATEEVDPLLEQAESSMVTATRISATFFFMVWNSPFWN